MELIKCIGDWKIILYVNGHTKRKTSRDWGRNYYITMGHKVSMRHLQDRAAKIYLSFDLLP